MVFAFAAQVLPDDEEEIHDIFHRSGAFRRFKDLLHHRGKLHDWNAFEEEAIRRALIAWCEKHGLPAGRIDKN